MADEKELLPEEKSRLRAVVLRWIGEKSEKSANTPAPLVEASAAPALSAAQSAPGAEEVLARVASLKQAEPKVVSPQSLPHEEKSAEPAKPVVAPKESRTLPRLLHLTLPSVSLPRLRLQVSWPGVAYLVLWLVFVGVIATAVVGTYIRPLPIAERLQEYVPLPYAIVHGRPIWYSTYHDEVDALKHFYAQSTSQPLPANVQLEDVVSQQLVRRAAATALASDYGIRVSESALAAELDRVAKDAGSEGNVSIAIRQLWGWSLEEYQQKVLRPFVMKRMLAERLHADPVIGRQLSGADDVRGLDVYLDTYAEGHTRLFR